MSDYKLQEYPCTCELNGPMCSGCVQFWTELGRSIREEVAREEC